MVRQRPNRQQTRQRRLAGGRTEPHQVQLSYIKSTVGPVLHADGVFGGMTPQGLFYLAFFSEHAKIPESVTLIGYEQDQVLREVKEVAQPVEWVREVGVEVTMNISVFRALRKWMDDKIAGYERIEALQPSDASSSTTPVEGQLQ